MKYTIVPRACLAVHTSFLKRPRANRQLCTEDFLATYSGFGLDHLEDGGCASVVIQELQRLLVNILVVVSDKKCPKQMRTGAPGQGAASGLVSTQ